MKIANLPGDFQMWQKRIGHDYSHHGINDGKCVSVWNQFGAGGQKAGKLRLDKSLGHMCLIIGYNPETKAVAISDSWGPDFAERWLTQKEARIISRDIFYVIQW